MKTILTSLPRLRTLAFTLICATVAGSAYAAADPPSRIARLNFFDGQVSFAAAGGGDWTPAALNRPLTTGDQLWVEPGSRSELHIGSTALRLGSQTSMGIRVLDDDTTRLNLQQGSLNLRLRALAPHQTFTIDTPNLAFALTQPGEYRLNVDPNGQTTTVIVRSGRGVALAENGARVAIENQQQIVFYDRDLAQLSATDAPRSDGFDQWAQQRDQREDQSVSARYVSREMTGYEDLDRHGTWSNDPQYGAIWIPTGIASSWAPYHSGHWTWVAPWGWTWVDNQAWGFAPFHYGRWAYVATRWAWVPGPSHVTPVYAPALVAFAGGNQSQGAWHVTSSDHRPSVGWFPLAPGETYRPAYAVSRNYLGNVNQTAHIDKSSHSTNNVTIINSDSGKTNTVYVNRYHPNAFTAVPASAFVQGQAVQSAIIPVSRAQIDDARIGPTPGLDPVRNHRHAGAHPAEPRDRPSQAIPVAPGRGTTLQAPPMQASPLLSSSGHGSTPPTSSRPEYSVAQPFQPSSGASAPVARVTSNPPEAGRPRQATSAQTMPTPSFSTIDRAPHVRPTSNAALSTPIAQPDADRSHRTEDRNHHATDVQNRREPSAPRHEAQPQPDRTIEQRPVMPHASLQTAPVAIQPAPKPALQPEAVRREHQANPRAEPNRREDRKPRRDDAQGHDR